MSRSTSACVPNSKSKHTGLILCVQTAHYVPRYARLIIVVKIKMDQSIQCYCLRIGSIGYFILAFGPYCERIIKVKLPEEDDDGVSGYLEKLDLY